MGSIHKLHRAQMGVSGYIKFIDPIVGQICASEWGDGKGITYAQAKRVASIGTTFQGRSDIAFFPEFVFFTSAQEIPASAFDGSSILDIDLSETTSIGNFAFQNCPLTGYRVNAPKLQTIGYGAFMGSGIVAIDDLGKVVRLPYQSSNGVFKNCASLREVHLPSSLTSIGRFAFSACNSLSTVDGWDNVTAIEPYCFEGCKGLPQVFALPRSLITLEGYSFRRTAGLEWMIISEGVTTIGGYTWNSSTNFKGVVCKATTPPTLGSYTGWGSSRIAYVPDDSVSAYQSATNWASGQIAAQSDMPSDVYELVKDYL